MRLQGAAVGTCDRPDWIQALPGTCGERERGILRRFAHRLALARWVHVLPSISVAVFRGLDVIATGARGWANVEQGVCATPQTVYAVASLLKPMVATALLHALNEPLTGARWGPSSRVLELCETLKLREELASGPNVAPEILLEDLLAHAVGVAQGSLGRQADLWGTPPPTLEEQLSKVEFTRWDGTGRRPYQNDAYSLAGALLALVFEQRLAGEEPSKVPPRLMALFDRAMSALLFQPLGMEDTAVVPAPTLQARLAHGYGIGEFEYAPAARSRFFAGPAAECYSTASDVARFLAQVASVRTPEQGADALGAWPRAVLATRTPHVIATLTPPRADPGPWKRCPGWSVAREVGVPGQWLRHFGDAIGYRSVAVAFAPDDPGASSWGLVLVANGQGYRCVDARRAERLEAQAQMAPDGREESDEVEQELFDRAKECLDQILSGDSDLASAPRASELPSLRAMPPPDGSTWFLELFQHGIGSPRALAVREDVPNARVEVVWAAPADDPDSGPTLPEDVVWDRPWIAADGERRWSGRSPSRGSTLLVRARPSGRQRRPDLLDGEFEESIVAGGRPITRSTYFLASRAPRPGFQGDLLAGVQGSWTELRMPGPSGLQTGGAESRQVTIQGDSMRLRAGFVDAPLCSGRIHALTLGRLRAVLRAGVPRGAPPPRVQLWYFPEHDRLLVAGRSPTDCGLWFFARA